MDFNGDLNLATLQPAPVFPELYQELWWYSGGNTAIGNAGSAGNAIQKGSTASTPSFSSSQTHLFTLNSSWPASQQYAFEATLWTSGAYACNAQLYDVTAGAVVSGTQISTTSTTSTVIRSGKFTLIPGHTYGITYWSVTGSGTTVYITDASLIIFPSSPLTSPSVSAISLANPSGNTLKEAYIPLWIWSSSHIGSGSPTSSSPYWLQKGTTTFATSTSSSATNLFSLSSAWSNTQKFAFEASIQASSSGTSVYAELWDTTAGAVVSGANVSTTSGTFTVVRSGSFTLNPTHNYGVAVYTSNTSIAVEITKAHLVALA